MKQLISAIRFCIGRNYMECPKCGSDVCIKDGIVKSKQRFKCKACNFRFTVFARGKDETTKQQAWQLHLQGFGNRSIAKMLQCSHVSIYNWIRGYKMKNK